MSYEASQGTIARLQWHAGLASSPPLPGSVSVADCTGPAADVSRLDEAINDVLQTMKRLNQELNGNTPSATIEGATLLPRQVAYAVAEIIRMLRYESQSSEAARMVETSWSAVLAGDIDNLNEHLRDEDRAPG